MLGKYSKAYGALIGGVVGCLIAFGIIPQDAVTPELQGGIVAILSTLTVVFFPKNANT